MEMNLGLLLCALPTLCLTCYAPPLVMGPACNAGGGLIGMSADVKVHYTVSQINTAGTLLCCDG